MSGITLEGILDDPTILFGYNKTEGTGKTDEFLNCDALLASLKSIVDPVIKESEESVLDEIYVDGLDASQVWGQVKLVFDGVEKSIWSDISEFKSNGFYNEEKDEQEEEEEEVESEEAFGETEGSDSEEVEMQEGEEEEVNSGKEEDSEIDENEIEEEIEEEENDEAMEDEGEEESENEQEGDDHFGLDDEVFNLDEYKRQVLALEDNDFSDQDDEDVDFFGDLNEDDDDEMYTYDDFFDKVDNKKGHGKGGKDNFKGKGKAKGKKKDEESEFLEKDYDAAYDAAQADLYGEESEEEEEEEGNNKNNGKEENLSTFEKQQRELQKQIAELEAESIAEKKWTMKGEVSGKQRNSDTLLEEELEFDRTAKPVPVITQETTESIEEIIKRRIVNQEFDEVTKRIISELNNFKKSKKVDVSEEKSGKSLAELYEDEYSGKANGKEEVNEVLEQAHAEITELFKDVTYQLDSLYSSHFVPRPKEKLMDVRIETSTISMEDAQPLTMSGSNSLAPQEIYKAGTKIGKDEVLLKSGVVMAKAELERDDKQRLHRAKKRKQHMQSRTESIKKNKVETKQQ